MNKKIYICIGMVLIILVATGIITSYVDSKRVETGHEPKYCIKLVSNDGSKVTYLGLGYKVIRHVGVSPKEPYESNIDAKMGSWFMKDEWQKPSTMKIEYTGQTVDITNITDIEIIKNILVNLEYNNEECDGIVTHKITLDNDIYYIKEFCKEIQKGNKQAKITDEDLKIITNIFEKESNKIFSKYSKIVNNVKIELNNPNNWKYEEIQENEENNFYKYALKLYKNEDDKYAILYFYNNQFGVCGTGRTSKNIILNNGKEATIGYYDENENWSDISFYNINKNIAVLNYGLINTEADEVIEFVKTINITENN